MNMVSFERVLNESRNMLGAILGMHAEKISEAFEKNDRSLTVNLGLKLTPGDGEDVKVESSIAFTEGRIKDAISTVVSDQPDIPGIE